MNVVLSMAIIISTLYVLYCAEKIQRILNPAKENKR